MMAACDKRISNWSDCSHLWRALVADAAATIREAPERNAYVIEIDGKVVGRADYRLRGSLYKFFHTEIDADHAGEGLGTRLVRHSLDDVRSKGGLVVPICPFFVSFIAEHPEYEDLVDVEATERVKRAASS